MTNEEKAKEIAHDYFKRGQLGLVAIDTESAGYNCAMQAMQWKEQILINKACEWLTDNATKHIHGQYSFLKGLMLEEFRQAMKGGEYESNAR